MAQLGKYLMTKPKSFSGLATKSSIAAMFGKAPQQANNMMIQLLAQYRGKSLESDLMKLGVKYFATDDEYTWDLIGSSRRNIPLLECRVAGSAVSASSDNVGADGAEFELVFGEDWFHDGQMIVGEKPDLYPIMIVGVRTEGVNQTVYTCVASGGVQAGIPAEELTSGKKFSGEFFAVSDELSRERMGGNVTTPTNMRGEFSTLRYGHKVTGTADKYQVKVGIPVVDKGGQKKVYSSWMPYIQWKIEEEWSCHKNRLLMYARSNRTAEGLYLNKDHKSKLSLKIGMGFREQMEVSNTIYYNIFSLKLIENLLFDLSESKLDYGQRKFILKTGERGAVQFHKAAQDIASGWNGLFATDNNPALINKTSHKLHDNALSMGYQFVEYRAPNQVTVRVEVDPIYDDRERNKIMHPKGGVAESYRYDIYDIGTPEYPNMKIAKVQGLEDMRGFQAGPFGNPFTGEKNINYASTDEDSAVMHLKTTMGSIIYDPSRTASLIPTILQ